MQSHLDIFDLATGTIRTVWSSDKLFEAPNWDPDGQSFLINGDGRLWRIGIDGSGPWKVPTGFATACNNDHGISPDGSLIALSHKTDGLSTIYTVPAAGGTPTRISAKQPSYWHGFSPDGKTIAYCCRRRPDQYDIAISAVTGGSETQLTGCDQFEGHNDGPDYSPDGAWIWFNSDRDGHAQIYKMRPDGSEVTRITHDRSVNWFPHPSPCGTHILYLAYPTGTCFHPRNLDVGLRLMSPDGTSLREVARFNGGQGTINVPCWAPDGSAFAYMRYGPS